VLDGSSGNVPGGCFAKMKGYYTHSPRPMTSPAYCMHAAVFRLAIDYDAPFPFCGPTGTESHMPNHFHGAAVLSWCLSEPSASPMGPLYLYCSGVLRGVRGVLLLLLAVSHVRGRFRELRILARVQAQVHGQALPPFLLPSRLDDGRALPPPLPARCFSICDGTLSNSLGVPCPGIARAMLRGRVQREEGVPVDHSYNLCEPDVGAIRSIDVLSSDAQGLWLACDGEVPRHQIDCISFLVARLAVIDRLARWPDFLAGCLLIVLATPVLSIRHIY
jgi:hypothetical protein